MCINSLEKDMDKLKLVLALSMSFSVIKDFVDIFDDIVLVKAVHVF